MENQVIHQFSCGHENVVMIELREYKGKHYLDFRVYFPLKETGEMHPTKKGITINVDFLEEFKKAISLCEEKLSEKVSE